MAVKMIRRKDGTRYFQIDFRDQDGRRIREHGGATKTDALYKLSKRKAEVREGEYVNPKSIRVNTVKGSADTFLSEYALTSRYYDIHVAKIVEYFGGAPLVEAFTFEQSILFRRWLEDGGASGSKVRKLLGTTVTWCNFARRQKLIPSTHHYEVERPPENDPVEAYLTPEQWRAVVAELSPADAKLATLAVATGGRRLKEVACLTRERIDWNLGTITFTLYKSARKRQGKAARTVKIPIGKVAREILRSEVGQYALTDDNGEPYASDRQRGRFGLRVSTAMLRAGIPPWLAPDGRIIKPSFKWLRDSVGTWLGKTRRFNDPQIGILLGHKESTKTMTARYVHYQIDDLEPMIEVLDAILENRTDSATDTTAANC